MADLGPPKALDSALWNADLAPTVPADRSWGLWNFAALWAAMSVCIPTYMMSSSMIAAGLSWRESVVVILLGNAIVLVPMLVNGHAGARHGISYPVFARASYGVVGAHLPALLRSVVACGWFGIQTWIGGLAIFALVASFAPGFADPEAATWMGHSLAQYGCFLAFWAMNLYFVQAGTESIKWLETLAAPFLVLMGLALLVVAARSTGGMAAMLAASDQIDSGVRTVSGWRLFLPWLTAMVGFWATLALNIPDFTRFARSQRDQMIGQSLGLLITMPLFAFIGIAVTGASLILWGEALWNPVDVLARLSAASGRPFIGGLALIVLIVATLSTNIAANVVSPANALSNLMPGRISTRAGGMIAASAGVLIFPWWLLDRYQSWLLSYSGLLGAVGGVLVCDYVVVRGGRLRVDDLYRRDGAYAYRRGVNPAALMATALGAATAISGRFVDALEPLFSAAWFSASIVAFLTYAWLMRASPSRPNRRPR